MPGSRKLTIRQRLRRFPPIVCRLLARTGPRNHVRPLTDQEIARESGLPVAKVRSLAWLTSWDEVPCGDMLAFSSACGVDLSDRHSIDRHSRYIKARHRFQYLKRDPAYETLWKPMHETYVDYLRSQQQ